MELRVWLMIKLPTGQVRERMIGTSQGDTACLKFISDHTLFCLTLTLNFHLEIIINAFRYCCSLLLSICPEVHYIHKKLSDLEEVVSLHLVIIPLVLSSLSVSLFSRKFSMLNSNLRALNSSLKIPQKGKTSVT
ncbi:hypothetical protein V8G54_007566 [Vigna mungo]|uniref:Uncharacterized protein n=1 Tax=Vigna mungo TaxID=3915 RepID=A0AAQ3S5K6_VIGMU